MKMRHRHVHVACAVALAIGCASALPTAARAEGFVLPSPQRIASLLKSSARSCPGADQVPARATLRVAERATLCLINRTRSAHRLPLLKINRRLATTAAAHSRDMVRHRYFAHVDASGHDPTWRILRTRYAAGAPSWWLGENIAWGSGALATPALTFAAWMHSPPHVANILNRHYRRVGIGLAPGSPAPAKVGGLPSTTYTTDFGSVV